MTRIKYNYAVYLRPVLLMLIVAGIVLHFVNLDADAPIYFAGHGQSLSSDPPQYLYFARNNILFENPESFDNDRWQSFGTSIVNGLGYAVFSIFGISRFNANLAGLILMLLSILIFIFALRKVLNLDGLLLAAVLLLFNKALFVYGRLPYLENGMLFFIALMVLVFIRYRHTLGGQITIGALIALTVLSGKLFGIIMIAPVMITMWLEGRQNRVKAMLTIIGSTIVSAIAWMLILYGGDIEAVLGYYRAQSVDLYGFPEALQSPVIFIERLINYGNDNRLYYHAPVLGTVLFIVLANIVSRFRWRKLKENPVFIFMLSWLAVGVLFFMIGNYRPLRYAYFLYFPMIAIASMTITGDLKGSTEKGGFFRHFILFAVAWICLEQAVFILFSSGQFDKLAGRFVWYTAPIALILVLIEYKLRLLHRLRFSKYNFIWTVLFIALVLFNFGRSYIIWHRQTAFNLKEAGRDLGEMVGDKAVIGGPMAPALLYENNLKGMIYAVGISDDDPDYFRKYPITHFATEASASGLIIEKFPELEQALNTADFWIRDSKILLVRINHLTGNPRAAGYRPTDLELGRVWMDRRVYDSALVYINRFADEFPDNKTAIKLLSELLPANGYIDEGLAVLEKGIRLYPDDYVLYILKGTFYHKMYYSTNERRFLDQAYVAYADALRKNRFCSKQIEEIMEKFAKN